MSRPVPVRDPKDTGILRCMICGVETRRVPKGLNYGFPRCCGQTMRVITPAELREEQDFWDMQEDEENYMRQAAGGK